MNKIKLILLISLPVLLWACEESYPSINEILPEHPDEVYPKEGEENLRVPIMPSMSDPQFSVVTRGGGVFESWDKDPDRWKQAIFHLFAYSSPNKYNPSPANMTDRNDHQTDPNMNLGTSCLLYDRTMRITNRIGDVQLFTTPDALNEYKFYYPINEQNRKYKFYCYYADDAAGDLEYSSDTLGVPITIDGYQDIMHSFAYHTKEEYNKFISNLDTTHQATKVLTGGGMDNMLYSTTSGHRGINPIFRINHMMSRFNIKVQGAGSEDGSIADGDYRNVVITGVEIKSPYRGHLTIANDRWTEETYLQALNDRHVLWWDTITHYIPLRMFTDSLTGARSSLYNDVNFPLKPGASHFTLKDKNPRDLGESMVLPAVKKLRVRLKSFYLNLVNDQGRLSLQPNQPVVYESPEYDVQLRDPSQSFEPGKEYTIAIYVYGIQTISIRAVLQDEWKEGGQIDIDPDKLDI